ncbi:MULTISPECIES: PPOX class F420-dependent oxidoreductase [Streptomyces]|uniref:PPOX class F420-dependent oxidoreductase n=1 Tax=Streptomyces tsukubensis (strain DSM 42081 / NBRC 108919 / NRRL 18488 / 9993) TaxID=1114943 RepID=I2NA85_STRT9|nr:MULTISPECIES: PPOX class F420-dependent oxidoreductase [Streptomyces]AZK97743.1 PPOX class F420-dependent enzyme [Streptomyces tsukubensis]EIF93932.1 oxidoreductase [Streptomyces tsukubensis NRRL18488]MYS64299.1 TIGR03618 family F420-dependent PPOX class oxidoreductase [Streptomyces sp. SID5473]QKM66326.1 PPOX class F420-dependent oxidoreductase [Streptomyces tsukubensis NRRL18488]TAI45336.1 PPOX class F420-dependent oxidoreductase [Streptomyces tsukubensis]
MDVLPNDLRPRIAGPNIWYVATVNADGSPHISPMWVGLDGDLVLFNTAVGRVKERNLHRDPRVALCHASPSNPYDRIRISGRVVRFVEGPEADRNIDELARSYLGTDRFEWRIPGEQRVIVLVEPLRVSHVIGVEPLPSRAPGSSS